MSLVEWFKSGVLAAKGWRRPAISFAAGGLSVLALAPFHVWPILFLTMPVLVWSIDATARSGALITRAALLSAAAAGWWFGFGYFLFGLFWIGEAFMVEAEKYAFLIPFAVTLLPAGLAFFFAGAAAAARLAWRDDFSRVLVLAVALWGAEWLRGHILTGLPWNTLGYALTYPLALMQWASILGVYALGLLTVVITAAPLVLMGDAAAGAARRRSVRLGVALAAIPLAAAAGWGALVLSREASGAVGGVKLRIVQPSVPQREKWRPENQGAIFEEHLALSRQDASGRAGDLAGITHVVWPEAAMPFLPLEHPQALARIGETLPAGTFLISGALRFASATQENEASKTGTERVRARRVFNSLLVFDGAGALHATYDKNHLVPFGEYLPMQSFWRYFGLGGLAEQRGGLAAGPVPRPLLSIPNLPAMGALICYEAIFPGDVVQGSERPGFLLSVTNDGWFGNTTGPRQHFHQARVRAVEEGLPLVRAANNGISAIIDAEGRILHSLGMNVRGVIDGQLPRARNETFYARFGDWPGLALALVCLGAVFRSRRGR